MDMIIEAFGNNPNKIQTVGLLIGLKNIIESTNNIVSVGNFYKKNVDFMIDLGVKLVDHLMQEFKSMNDGNTVINDD